MRFDFTSRNCSFFFVLIPLLVYTLIVIIQQVTKLDHRHTEKS